MGNNLNPDGAKIKALRIQRGWTQEQLAEIAGISTRTVQRAERANSAAFDTLRAIAGAFETDFDCLLRSEARDVAEPERQAVLPEALPVFGPEIAGPAPAGRPDVSGRRIWPVYVIAASALAAGLVAGVHLTSRIHRKAASNPEISLLNTAVHSQRATLQESVGQIRNLQSAEAVLSAAPNAVVQTAKPSRKTGIKRDAAEFRGTTGIAAPKSPVPEPAAQHALYLTLHPVEAELLPESRDIFSTYTIPDIVPASAASLEPDGGDAVEEQSTGAVRQALGQAAKKTGSFMSKVGTSLKRTF